MSDAIEGLQIPINSASRAQLRAFAEHLGLKVINFDNEAKIIAKIQASGYEEGHIIAFDPTTKAKDKSAAKSSPANGREMPEPLVELTVHEQQGAGGKRPVFVGVNGKALLIPRNKKVKVKLRYYNALAIAIETKFEYDEEAKANLPSDLPVHPYQVHSMPSQAEQDAYHAWYAAEEKRLAQEAA